MVQQIGVLHAFAKELSLISRTHIVGYNCNSSTIESNIHFWPLWAVCGAHTYVWAKKLIHIKSNNLFYKLCD